MILCSTESGSVTGSGGRGRGGNQSAPPPSRNPPVIGGIGGSPMIQVTPQDREAIERVSKP